VTINQQEKQQINVKESVVFGTGFLRLNGVLLGFKDNSLDLSSN
jgi:hypothetical protein